MHDILARLGFPSRAVLAAQWRQPEEIDAPLILDVSRSSGQSRISCAGMWREVIQPDEVG